MFCHFMCHMFQQSLYSILLRNPDERMACEVGTFYSRSTQQPSPSDLITPQSLSSMHYSILHETILVSSLINVLSHCAVALGVLNDTLVISIVLGVGFDVITRILQLLWWLHLTLRIYDIEHLWISSRDSSFVNYTDNTSTQDSKCLSHHPHVMSMHYYTMFFNLILTYLYIYQMKIHVRAILLYKSATRAKQVVHGALNNLRRIPGERYEDHLFAYSDLGIHLLAFGLSGWLLGREILIWIFVYMMVGIVSISYMASSVIPGGSTRSQDVETDKAGKEQKPPARKLCISIDENDQISCTCNACASSIRRRAIGSEILETSFTLHWSDGICQLWLSSFEEIHELLVSAEK